MKQNQTITQHCFTDGDLGTPLITIQISARMYCNGFLTCENDALREVQILMYEVMCRQCQQQ